MLATINSARKRCACLAGAGMAAVQAASNQAHGRQAEIMLQTSAFHQRTCAARRSAWAHLHSAAHPVEARAEVGDSGGRKRCRLLLNRIDVHLALARHLLRPHRHLRPGGPGAAGGLPSAHRGGRLHAQRPHGSVRLWDWLAGVRSANRDALQRCRRGPSESEVLGRRSWGPGSAARVLWMFAAVHCLCLQACLRPGRPPCSSCNATLEWRLDEAAPSRCPIALLTYNCQPWPRLRARNHGGGTQRAQPRPFGTPGRRDSRFSQPRSHEWAGMRRHLARQGRRNLDRRVGRPFLSGVPAALRAACQSVRAWCKGSQAREAAFKRRGGGGQEACVSQTNPFRSSCQPHISLGPVSRSGLRRRELALALPCSWRGYRPFRRAAASALGH